MSGRRSLARLASIAALVAVWPWASQPAAAQTTGEDAEPLEIVEADLAAFPIVRLVVSAHGSLAGVQLDPGDVRVVEDGENRDVEVKALSGDALDVALVIDTSGSMKGASLDAAKAAAASFLAIVPSAVRTSVIQFGDTATVAAAMSTDRAAARAAVDGLVADGETALYDATALGLEQLQSSRRAMVVLTDGADTVSATTSAEIAARLSRSGVDLFIVELQSDEIDHDALLTLTDAADGALLPAGDEAALTAAYASLAERLSNQYELRYTSAGASGRADLHVEFDGPSGVVTATTTVDRPVLDEAPATEAEAEAVVDEPEATTASPSLLEQGWVLWTGVALVGLSVTVLLAFAFAPGERRRDLASDRTTPAESSPAERMESIRARAGDLGDRALARLHRSRRVDAALDRAGLAMRGGELVVTVVAAAAMAGLLGFGLAGPRLGLVLFAVPVAVTPAVLQRQIRRRNRAFADQLPDALALLTATLRSGLGVAQAIDNLATEMSDPMAAEMRRVVFETRLGRDLDGALERTAERVDNEDFEWVVDAIRIQRQVGGDLAEILDRVAETIRSRNRLARQVRAVTAEGRLSAIVLVSLPFAIGAFVYAGNGDYLAPLYQNTAGQIMLAGSGVLLALGAGWLKRLVDIDY